MFGDYKMLHSFNFILKAQADPLFRKQLENAMRGTEDTELICNYDLRISVHPKDGMLYVDKATEDACKVVPMWFTIKAVENILAGNWDSAEGNFGYI